MNLAFDAVRFSLLAMVIGYAAYMDHKYGEVANKVWIYAPFGLALTLMQLAFEPQQLLPATLSFVATIAISFTLFYIGGWGGADAKAFLTIGACLPITPFVPFNLLFMLPLNVILVSAVLAFAAGKVKRTGAVRFLPYVFVSLFIVAFV